MKKSILRLGLLVLLVLMAVMASEVAAKAEVVFRDNFEALCSEGVPERVWMDGDMLQIRGQTNTYRTNSDFDMHIGTNVAIVNVTLDINTGNGTAWGKFKSMPDAYPDSAWEGTFSGRLIGGLYTGRGVGHGTGDLSGMQMKTVAWEIPYDPELMPPGSCSPMTDPPTLLYNEIRVLMPHDD